MTIICVTRGEEYTRPFLAHLFMLQRRLRCTVLLACDGERAYRYATRRYGWSRQAVFMRVDVQTPSLEGVLDEVISQCADGYILRLDDDETCSEDMIHWLKDGHYETHDHWSFPRVYHFFSRDYVLLTRELYPDLQTRLSIKSKAGGRSRLHEGSPFGFGETAPVVLEHHKFLVKSYETRQIIAARYDDYHPTFADQLKAYTLPEDAYRGVSVPLHHYNATIGAKAADIILS